MLCQSDPTRFPTPAQAARHGLQTAFLGRDSARRCRFRSEASECNLRFGGGALHSWSENPAVEPGEVQTGKVGWGHIHNSKGRTMSHKQKDHAGRNSQLIRITQIAVFLATAASLVSTGCSTLKDVRAARGSGTSHVFNAPFEKVWTVIPKAANELDLSVVGLYPDERYVLVERGWTAFSWGEKVAIFAEPLGTTRTEVEIVSKRVLATNITAPNWERRLLAKIAEFLGLPWP